MLKCLPGDQNKKVILLVPCKLGWKVIFWDSGKPKHYETPRFHVDGCKVQSVPESEIIAMIGKKVSSALLVKGFVSWEWDHLYITEQPVALMVPGI